MRSKGEQSFGGRWGRHAATALGQVNEWTRLLAASSLGFVGGFIVGYLGLKLLFVVAVSLGYEFSELPRLVDIPLALFALVWLMGFGIFGAARAAEWLMTSRSPE